MPSQEEHPPRKSHILEWSTSGSYRAIYRLPRSLFNWLFCEGQSFDTNRDTNGISRCILYMPCVHNYNNYRRRCQIYNITCTTPYHGVTLLTHWSAFCVSSPFRVGPLALRSSLDAHSVVLGRVLTHALQAIHVSTVEVSPAQVIGYPTHLRDLTNKNPSEQLPTELEAVLQ